MKKMIFTAAAVLAFSGIAFANTIEVKNNCIKIKSSTDEQFKIVKILVGKCEDEQQSAEQECLANGCTKWEAYYFGAKAWGTCMAEK